MQLWPHLQTGKPWLVGELNQNLEEQVEAEWESWMNKDTTTAERGIGKIRENSKVWWPKEIEVAIKARKKSM